MSNGKFALATAEQKAEINAVVTKKVFGRQKPKKGLVDPLNPKGFNILVVAFMKVFMIVPALVIGILSGVGALFEVTFDKTLETYRGK